MELEEQSKFVMKQVSELEWLQVITKILLLQLLKKQVFYKKVGNQAVMELIQLLWKEKCSENMSVD